MGIGQRAVAAVAAPVVLALALAGCGQSSVPSSTAPAAAQATATAQPEPSCACSYPPTPPPGAISSAAAIAAALRAAPGTGATRQVLWASIYPDPFVSHLVLAGGTPLPESSRQVWMVRLEGGLHAPTCPGDTLPTTPVAASDGPCLDAGGGVDMVLDLMTGNLLGWTH